MSTSDIPEIQVSRPAYFSAVVTRTLFVLLAASLAWMQPFPAYEGVSLTPTDIIFPFASLSWLISLALGGVRFRWNRVYWLFIFYFATMAVSSVFSAAPRTSYVKLAGEAYLLGIAVIGFNLLDSENRLKYLVYGWLAGSAIALLIGLFTLALFYAAPGHWLLGYTTYHYGAVPMGNFPRLSATFVSASMFCNYLNVTAVLLLIARRLGWVGPRLFKAFFAAVAVCSAFTVSIGLGGIFLAAGLWIWMFADGRQMILKKAAMSTGLAMAVAFLIPAFAALAPYESAPYSWKLPVLGQTVFPSPRLLVWQQTLDTIAANPLTGKGLNVPTSSVIFTNSEGTMSVLTDAHNIFLSVAAQNGLISLLALVLLCIYLIRIGLAGAERQPIVTGLTIAFLTAFVYQGLTGAFEDARHLWLLIGLIPAALQFRSRPQ